MECHVLNDFRRVLTQREMVRVLSPAGRESGNLAGYFQSKAFADKPLDLGAVIPSFDRNPYPNDIPSHAGKAARQDAS